tara:strand:+ start:251 stop:487 length:237 start_codon:yes stop_codon:yes gene_type:complete
MSITSVWVRGKTFEISELPTSKIQEYRANAYATFCDCLGHNKASNNEIRVMQYESELSKRGIEIDKSIIGKFNGSGSE